MYIDASWRRYYCTSMSRMIDDRWLETIDDVIPVLFSFSTMQESTRRFLECDGEIHCAGPWPHTCSSITMVW